MNWYRRAARLGTAVRGSLGVPRAERVPVVGNPASRDRSDQRERRQMRAVAPLVMAALLPALLKAQGPAFTLASSPLEIRRPVRHHLFFDVNSPSSGAFGYEDGDFEAWVYPIKAAADVHLEFLGGEEGPVEGEENAAAVEVRPESFTRVISSDSFTLKETLFAPVGKSGIILVLHGQIAQPMKVRVLCKPVLELMWPGANPSIWRGFDDKLHGIVVQDASGGWASAVAAPGAANVTLPLDPDQMALEVTLTPQQARQGFPIVFTASRDGLPALAVQVHDLEQNFQPLYAQTAADFQKFLTNSTQLSTDQPALDRAYQWSLISLHRALVHNPYLGTGMVAGYSVSSYNDRPGYGWFFGRDQMWAEQATTAAGSLEASRDAIAFLTRFQRADGRIPHEISQSASLSDWFKKYVYPWVSTDSTPLYIIGCADYYNATGDRKFVQQYWPNVQMAYHFLLTGELDADGFLFNGPKGEGWIEGGRLFPVQAEMYQQGVWAEALRGYAQLADAMHEGNIAQQARQRRQQVLAKMESLYWLPKQGYYSYATLLPNDKRPHVTTADGHLVSTELTVLPAVPLWWTEMQPDRALSTLRAMAGAALDTDWGERILSNQSTLFDPTGYHYGSVWPLFTGWASVAAYKYGQPELGYRLLLQNAQQEDEGPGSQIPVSPAGQVDEVFSGRFYRAISTSSHHQIWSSAMVTSPLLLGMAGLHFDAPHQQIGFAPLLPDDMHRLSVTHVPCGSGTCDLSYEITPSAIVAHFASTAGFRYQFTASLPGNAAFGKATLDGHALRPTSAPQIWGAVLRESFSIPAGTHEVRIAWRGGTDVYDRGGPDHLGQTSDHLKIVGRSYAANGEETVDLEGIAGKTYVLSLRGKIARVEGASPAPGHPDQVTVTLPPGSGFVPAHLKVIPKR